MTSPEQKKLLVERMGTIPFPDLLWYARTRGLLKTLSDEQIDSMTEADLKELLLSRTTELTALLESPASRLHLQIVEEKTAEEFRFRQQVKEEQARIRLSEELQEKEQQFIGRIKSLSWLAAVIVGIATLIGGAFGITQFIVYEQRSADLEQLKQKYEKNVKSLETKVREINHKANVQESAKNQIVGALVEIRTKRFQVRLLNTMTQFGISDKKGFRQTLEPLEDAKLDIDILLELDRVKHQGAIPFDLLTVLRMTVQHLRLLESHDQTTSPSSQWSDFYDTLSHDYKHLATTNRQLYFTLLAFAKTAQGGITLNQVYEASQRQDKKIRLNEAKRLFSKASELSSTLARPVIDLATTYTLLCKTALYKNASYPAPPEGQKSIPSECGSLLDGGIGRLLNASDRFRRPLEQVIIQNNLAWAYRIQSMAHWPHDRFGAAEKLAQAVTHVDAALKLIHAPQDAKSFVGATKGTIELTREKEPYVRLTKAEIELGLLRANAGTRDEVFPRMPKAEIRERYKLRCEQPPSFEDEKRLYDETFYMFQMRDRIATEICQTPAT